MDYEAYDLEEKAEMLIMNPEIREKLSEELIKIAKEKYREADFRVASALELPFKNEYPRIFYHSFFLSPYVDSPLFKFYSSVSNI